MNVRMLGEFSGFNACEPIKSDNRKRDAFVILMSEMDKARDHDQACGMLSIAYFIKPFRHSQLVKIIQNHGKAAKDFLIEQFR